MSTMEVSIKFCNDLRYYYFFHMHAVFGGFIDI